MLAISRITVLGLAAFMAITAVAAPRLLAANLSRARPTVTRHLLRPPAILTFATGHGTAMKIHAAETLGVAVEVRSRLKRAAKFTFAATNLTGPHGRRMDGLVVFRFVPTTERIRPKRPRTVTVFLTPRPELPAGLYRVTIEGGPVWPVPTYAKRGQAVLSFLVVGGA